MIDWNPKFLSRASAGVRTNRCAAATTVHGVLQPDDEHYRCKLTGRYRASDGTLLCGIHRAAAIRMHLPEELTAKDFTALSPGIPSNEKEELRSIIKMLLLAHHDQRALKPSEERRAMAVIEGWDV